MADANTPDRSPGPPADRQRRRAAGPDPLPRHRDELQDSYLTYAMSVIISRALPDVRDGLKPSQRRILVAMNDLGLGPDVGHQQVRRHRRRDDEALPPARRRVHLRHARPHGPGLGTCATGSSTARATSAPSPACRPPPTATPRPGSRPSPPRCSPTSTRDTVDFIDNYDGKYREPLVLPSKFPNLLVNGSDGIAVGMATDIPPHNLREVCDGAHHADRRPGRRRSHELIEIIPGPDFPTGGIIWAGRASSTATAPAAARSRSAPGPTSSRRARASRQIIITRGAVPADAQPRWPRRSASWSRTSGSRASRHPRRVERPQRRAGPPRHRPEARRRPAPGPQPALPVLAAAEDGQHHPAGPGRRPAADADAQGDDARSSCATASR